VTGRWAATNTLREGIGAVEGDKDIGRELLRVQAAENALALVETALDAAERRVKFGHDKACAWVTGGPNPPPCDCGHADLAYKVRAVREGK
jgi:hypothetical protein